MVLQLRERRASLRRIEAEEADEEPAAAPPFLGTRPRARSMPAATHWHRPANSHAVTRPSWVQRAASQSITLEEVWLGLGLK
eukprot:scaffold10268_cov51-Phaeocystis_antarctica.AAC.1